ncbi:MAG TPA: phosphatidylglycerophosphatase A [Polyangiales bacterium]|nr:phosphatidylglycerophosphatase A [Polyangiales bacterium]
MTSRIAYLLATWFGCGRVPRAPGTAGTLAALPLYWLLRELGDYGVVTGAIGVTAIGVWAAGRVERNLAAKDPQIVVIDEVAGLLVTLAPNVDGWAAVAVGVIAFRVLDWWKPWPAALFEARLPGGWGIVMDDVAAGAWAALIVVAFGHYFGC